jgi:RNA polymerase sigma factor (sigma-70 family)
MSDRPDSTKPAGPAEVPGQRDPAPVSFEKFFREHFAAVHRTVLYRVLGLADRSLADDIVQDTFIVALQRWDLLSSLSPEQALAYLRTTAIHKLIDSYRSTRFAMPTDVLPDYPGGPDPEADAIAADTAHHELQKMPPARRRVMALVMVGFGAADIADLTGMSTATVRSHLRDARKQIRAETPETAGR